MPTSSFWTAEDRIPVSQKKVSIQAENGLSYELGQQINFVIPGSTGFMMPSETYLRMDVKIQYPAGSTARTPLMLDGDLGANVLIRDIRISSGGAQNQILEELQNVNVLTTLKYDYETNENLRKKRELTEGAVPQSNVARFNQGTTVSNLNNVDKNPYFDKSADKKSIEDADFKTVKALLTLPTGIFQNDRIFPLGMTDGLRIEIILEDASRCFRTLDNQQKDIRVTANPTFHSLNGSDSAPTSWVKGGAATSFFLKRDNGMVALEACPFVIGEKLAFVNPETGFSASAPGDSRILGLGGPSGSALVVTVTDIVYNSSGVGGGNASSGLIQVSFASATNTWSQSASGGPADINGSFQVYSCGIVESATFTPRLSIDNVELIVQKVEMPSGYVSKMNSMLKAGGAMNYDFLSYTNYKYSQLESDRVVNIRLPIQNSRCKSILAIPTDATPYTARQVLAAETTYKVNSLFSDTGSGYYAENKSTRSGLVGIADHASNYQFIYDGKLNPNRKVPLSRMSVNTGDNVTINQQCFIENEKALKMAGIDPLSFESFQRNFFIGRALSSSSGVYDARGRDFNLQVEYQETTAPTKAKLWNVWVAHLRRIVVRGDSIALEV
tara:strand:- start:6885 stop:8723 length:1839 start_codon:yes stop_codon:yes gene_type:complete